MAKQENFKQFYFKTLEGEDVLINCWTYSYSRGWGHRACLVYIGDRWVNQEKRITYYNRTWERFTYESILYKMINNYFKNAEADFLKKQVQALADRESEAVKARFDGFIQKFNALSDETRKKIKNSDVLLNSKEEADALINSALMLDALK